MPKPKGGQEKENAANMALEMFFSLARGATNSSNRRYSERQGERKRERERDNRLETHEPKLNHNQLCAHS